MIRKNIQKALVAMLMVTLLGACGSTSSSPAAESKTPEATETGAPEAAVNGTSEATEAGAPEAVGTGTSETTEASAPEDSEAAVSATADDSAVEAFSSTETEENIADTSEEADFFETVESEYYREPGSSDYDTPAFNFDTGYLEEFPDETEDVSIDNVEFFTTEDGNDAIRVFFRFTNNSGEETSFNTEHYCYALQDENPLDLFYGPIPVEEANISNDVDPGNDIVCACSFMLNTDSPVVFVVTVLNDDLTEDIPVVAKIIEIK